MKTSVAVLSSSADFFERTTEEIQRSIGLADFSRVETIAAAMLRFSPSNDNDCSVCVVHGDDPRVRWSVVAPIVRRYFAPVLVIESQSTGVAIDPLDSSADETPERTLEAVLAAGTHRDARLGRVVDELAHRFALDEKRARAIRHLADGGARSALPWALTVGEDRVRQIMRSIHRSLRTTRVDEIAYEIVNATLRGRSAFYDREPSNDRRR